MYRSRGLYRRLFARQQETFELIHSVMRLMYLFHCRLVNQLAIDEPPRSNRPFSDLAAGRPPPTLPTILLGNSSEELAAPIGDVLSNEPVCVSVFRRKSSSEVVIPPSSEDSMWNGSTGDEPPEPFTDSGEVCPNSIDP